MAFVDHDILREMTSNDSKSPYSTKTFDINFAEIIIRKWQNIVKHEFINIFDKLRCVFFM